jgi:hypothetical protein
MDIPLNNISTLKTVDAVMLRAKNGWFESALKDSFKKPVNTGLNGICRKVAHRNSNK